MSKRLDFGEKVRRAREKEAKRKPVRSPAYVLVEHLYRHGLEATGHSWLRLNTALHKAVLLAIDAGLHFDLKDFSLLYSHCKGAHWFGAGASGGEMGEGFYAAAVKVSNLSACQSYEAFVGRVPFIYDGRRLAIGSTIPVPELDALSGRKPAKQTEQLLAHVTSFCGADGIGFTTYKPATVGGAGCWRVSRRVSVSVEQVRVAERPRRRGGEQSGCNAG